jgi:hypothetical protein
MAANFPSADLCFIAYAGIAHGNIQPDTILIDGGTVRLTEFADAMVLGIKFRSTAAGLVLDRHMLACTILYTVAGGRSADNQPLDFDELMEATETGFGDIKLFDHVRAARLELADLLQAMVNPDIPLEELLSRPFYWCRAILCCKSTFGSMLRLTAVCVLSLWAGRQLEQWNTWVRRSGT